MLFVVVREEITFHTTHHEQRFSMENLRTW